MKDYKNNEYFKRGLVVGIFSTTAVVLVVVIAFLIYSLTSDGVLNRNSKNKIKFLTKLIQEHYYEEVDNNDLIEGMYKGLLEGLGDPYTDYYTVEEADIIRNSLKSEYCGLGAALSQDRETKVVSVASVYEGSAAEQAGIVQGDIIISADGKTATDYDLKEFVQYTRGEEGTSFELKYLHDGEEFTKTITRVKIVMPTIRKKMLDGKVGYIILGEFGTNTARECINAINELKADGAKGIIFDLRINGGGVVETATELLDEILPAGNLVTIKYKDGRKEEFNSDDQKKLDLPIVVLTSKDTASAAEIFAGAIRDYGAGTIIGETTYGKGVVQHNISLKDGSMVNITSGRYYTPKGECIHKKGIEPDIALEFKYLGDDKSEYIEEYDNQIRKGMDIILHTR